MARDTDGTLTDSLGQHQVLDSVNQVGILCWQGASSQIIDIQIVCSKKYIQCASSLT